MKGAHQRVQPTTTKLRMLEVITSNLTTYPCVAFLCRYRKEEIQNTGLDQTKGYLHAVIRLIRQHTSTECRDNFKSSNNGNDGKRYRIADGGGWAIHSGSET
jgi:hypothetical protein